MSEEPAADTGVTDNDKLVAFVAYVLTPVAPVVILFLEDKKNRPFIRAHNVQALIWGLLTVVVGTLTLTLGGLILWGIGVYWGYRGYQGEYVNIPLITGFAKNQGWA